MNRIVIFLERIGAGLASISLLLMMFIVSADATMRYLLHSPISWANSFVTYYLMVVVGFLPLSITFRYDDHIRIDFVQQLMNKKLSDWFEIIGLLMSVICFAIIAYAAAHETMAAWRTGKFYPGLISWPVWLSLIWVALGAALLVPRLLLHCADLARHKVERHSELDRV